MLSLKDVTLRRGDKVLFTHTDLTVHRGQRVGVTGANGAGKSSLFRLLQGELDTDTGEVDLAAGLVFASTDQEVAASPRLAREYVIDGDTSLRAVEARLQQAEGAGDGQQHATLLAEYEQHGGYTAAARAASLLSGLGFSEAQQQQPLADFSGGWRMRLNLARALMCPSDVLLLDEPTNHLDLDAVLWLESWLLRYPGTLLLISHDREFLDRVCTHIAHMEHQRIRLYTGNYSAFERQRAEQLAAQQADYVRQQREIAHIQDFVRRFRAKATKAKQAQSRLKALERMELISPAHVDSAFHFAFLTPSHLPSPLLSLEQVDCGYASEQPVLQAVSAAIDSGARIGLLGMNGAGKSTLVRTLVGDLPRLTGQSHASPHLKVGYFAQHQLEQLPQSDTVLAYLQAVSPEAPETELRDFAGGFGFQGDNVFAVIETLSGGEKARLVLAGIVRNKPNFLLLDEPTNHLDIEMRHALTLALQDYPGALVVVSHDRHLLRCCADELWLVANGQVAPFDADLDAYTQWLAEQRKQLAAAITDAQPAAAKAHTASARREEKRLAAQQRQKLQPLKRTVARAEAALDEVAASLTTLETTLADPEMYTDAQKERLQTLLVEQARLKKRHDQLESDWMLAMEALEAASTS
ncbi:MAG TPA: ABC transporter ATP-binding protein [Gammaproteobacteria bacterium]|nr:ABC transporter ATP-binding protein [Gammaproteobacteria bacterium]